MIVLINGAFGVGKTTTAQLLTRELADPNTIRIQLAASPQTLRSRIVNRPEAEGPRAWALAHLESGLALAANDEYGYVIDTDSLSLSGGGCRRRDRRHRPAAGMVVTTTAPTRP